jgi:anti-anti-sigma factor
MGVHVEMRDDVTVAKLQGNFFADRETAELRTALRRIADGGNKKLVIDLGGSGRMSSVGLSVLVELHTNYVKRGGRVILANLDKGMEELLHITRLARVFELGPSLPEATAKFGAPKR